MALVASDSDTNGGGSTPRHLYSTSISASPSPTKQLWGTSSSSSISSSSSVSLSSSSGSISTIVYQPLYFNKDIFNSPLFNINEFIADCRNRTPHNDLNEVLTDLQNFDATLDNELVELINKDYTDFVNLSAKLVGIDKTIETLQAPLEKLSKDIQNVRDLVAEAVRFLEGKLYEKRETANKKACLQLFINIDKTVRKIERLFDLEGEAYLSDSLSNNRGVVSKQPFLLKADEETSNLIQRAANDFNQLKFYVSSGKDFLFVKNMERRISFIETLLKEGLERLFREGVLNKNIDIVANCLRTYAAINKETEAESLFRSAVVKPYYNKIISIEKLEQGGPRGSCGGLSSIYNDILQFITKECTILLQLTHKAIRGFSFLVNSVWSEAVEQLNSKLPTIFAPGMPDLFHKNYLITHDFIERFENFCHNRTELLHLRSHSSYLDFLKRWNLAIYFGIQFQTIAQKVETGLVGKDQSVKIGDNAPAYGFVLPATENTWSCLWMCWDQKIFLPALVDRFLGLSLQIISRYKTWITTGLQLLSPSSESQTEGLPISEEEKQLSWATYLTIDHLIFVLNDANQLTSKLNTLYPILQQRGCVAKLNEQICTLVTESYSESATSIATLATQITELITQSTVKRCVEGLQPLRGITATYRMTNKSVPTRPSIYVADILRPLSALQQQLVKVSLSEEDSKIWNLGILSLVTEKYVEMAKDLLNTVTHQSEVLRKVLKKANTASGGIQDNDKIVLQLFLDVREYGEQIKKFGVVVSSFIPYQQLLAAVQDGERIQAIVSGTGTGAPSASI